MPVEYRQRSCVALFSEKSSAPRITQRAEVQEETWGNKGQDFQAFLSAKEIPQGLPSVIGQGFLPKGRLGGAIKPLPQTQSQGWRPIISVRNSMPCRYDVAL